MDKHIYYNYKVGRNSEYSPFPDDFFSGEPLASFEDLNSKYDHYLCPAVKDWHRNNWIIQMPFDLEFIFNKEKNKFQILTDGMDPNIIIHLQKNKDIEYTDAQLQFHYLFWADKKQEIWAELNHHPRLIESNIELVAARFPISKWTRPIFFGFKVIDINKKIVLKKDMPLFYIRFYSKNDFEINFKLIKQTPNEKVLKNLYKDNMVKFYSKFASWGLIKKRLHKECPFSFLWTK